MSDRENFEKFFEEFELFFKGLGVRNPMHAIAGIVIFVGLVYLLFR